MSGVVPELADAVVAQWLLVVGAVNALPADSFAKASGLPGWTVGDLVMHVARSAGALIEALTPTDGRGRRGGSAGAGRPQTRPVSAIDYLTGTGARAESIADVARELSASVSGSGPVSGSGMERDHLATEVSRAQAALAGLIGPTRGAVAPDRAAASGRVARDGAASGAAAASGGEPHDGGGGPPDGEAGVDRLVVTPGGPMMLGEFLRTRVVEAVVHGLDLGVTPSRPALRVATRLIAELFAARVPGHAVELRVPPFAAVQVVEGPRHTRGTPPNVVEAGPVPFLLVCTGRVDFADAVADGRITASGERSDISPHLPLL
ncbi:Mycothiol-dependent maleylpyruvate isomerase metal-binding domain-containing protein [Frankia sp. AiPs1]|uniref:sterol carrier family protein n=1 Tax=Frankia sp. AiPa1 TaxID=573492 RepID=UPI00202B8255|nr:sterol carrier family protein [Frankia sp. AiPa1]MCL9759714.1 sterol carrier family protein [Frankia sp. AiPa1]